MPTQPLLRAKVSLPFRSGVGKDVAINVFHFAIGALDLTEENLGLIRDLCQGFYNTAGAGALHETGYYLSNWIDRGRGSVALSIREVNGIDAIPDPTPPHSTHKPWTFLGILPMALGGEGAATDLPTEVAAVSSIAGFAPLVGTETLPFRSRRGRIYVGPLQSSTLANDDLGRPIMNPQFLQDLKLNTAGFVASTQTLGPLYIYSEKHDNATQVEHGWVNNEFDTQRRRSIGETNRVLWSLPFP